MWWNRTAQSGDHDTTAQVVQEWKQTQLKALGAGVFIPVIRGTCIVDDDRQGIFIFNFHELCMLLLTPATIGVYLLVSGATHD